MRACALFVALLCGIAPVGAEDSPESSAIAQARKDLIASLPEDESVTLSEKKREAQNRRAREAARAMHLVDVRVRLLSPRGSPFPGVDVLAIHEGFDVSNGPSVTDGRGVARLRLPRGTWRLELATRKPAKGRLVFARTRIRVRDPGERQVALDRKRRVRFRSRLGTVRAAHAVILSWPDLSFHKRVDVKQGEFEITTIGEEPMILQAVRRPDASGGYVLRQGIGIETTVIETDPEDATAYVFDGKGKRKLCVKLWSADILPYDLAFSTKGAREILFSGLEETVLSLRIEAKKQKYGFFARPFALPGQPRTFTGGPPFRISVGHQQLGNYRYRGMKNAVCFRVFLRDPNGLVMDWAKGNPYAIAWSARNEDLVYDAGRTKPAHRTQTSPIAPEIAARLRYRIAVAGPGEKRTVDVVGHGFDAEAASGKVHVKCFSEMEPNVRLWAAAVDRAAGAYELTCPRSKVRIDIDHALRMPPGLAGMGGFAGGRGWMWLPESRAYGFTGQIYWTGLLAHELGHVYHYGHSNPTQNRIMQQAGRRAGRKLWAIRPGMERVPEGNRFLALLEAVTRGEVSVETNFRDEKDVAIVRDYGQEHGSGDGVLTPNLEITGEDGAFMWYYRALYGPDVDAPRLRHAWSWSWWLTRAGFSDCEIQIAMFSYAAGSSLAWLARMRGTNVHDHRIDAALEELKRAGGGFVWQKERGAILDRWRKRDYDAEKDLGALTAKLRSEVGHRPDRVTALLAIARQHLIRGDEDTALAALAAALVEARLGNKSLLRNTLTQSAVLWAAR